MQNEPVSSLALDSAIAQSEVRSQLNAQLIAESKRKKWLHFLADLWSQSEFRTERNAERKTNPKSEWPSVVVVTIGYLRGPAIG